MAKSPSFQWYPKDCDTDEYVRSMNDEAFGFFVRCLNHSWLNEGLPADTELIRQIFRKSPRNFSKIWQKISMAFVEKNGRLFNPKQEEIREAQRAYLEESRTSGKKGAEKRWGAHSPPNGTPNGTPIGSSKGNDSSAFASASAFPIEETKNVSSEGLSPAFSQNPPIPITTKAPSDSWKLDAGYLPFVALWREIYPNAIDEDFADSHRLWCGLDFEQQQVALKNMRDRHALGQKVITLPWFFTKNEWKRGPDPIRAPVSGFQRPKSAIEQMLEEAGVESRHRSAS